jgi:hypothetical protein
MDLTVQAKVKLMQGKSSQCLTCNEVLMIQNKFFQKVLDKENNVIKEKDS